jgi:hypothetical protein
LGIGGLSNKQNWLSFLDACATAALEKEQGIVTFNDEPLLG